MANQGPAIIGFRNGRAFGGKKRLNGNDLTVLEPTSIAAIKVADNSLRFFVQAPPNAMPGKGSDGGEGMRVGGALNRTASSVDRRAGTGRGQRLLAGELRGMAAPPPELGCG